MSREKIEPWQIECVCGCFGDDHTKYGCDNCEDCHRFKERTLSPVEEVSGGCNICGGRMVLIRGRYPNTEKRPACPTCCMEKLERIHELSDKDYGKASQVAS